MLYLEKLRTGTGEGSRLQVRSYNIVTKKWVAKFKHARMTHPAGIIKVGTTLYVLCQDDRSLRTFNSATGDFIATLIANFKDDPEQIALSPC